MNHITDHSISKSYHLLRPIELIALIIESSLSLYITTTGGILGATQNATLTPSTGKLLRLNIGMTTGLYEPPKRILIVCSSHPRGIYLSEFAEPYNILRKRFGGKERVEFVIASPEGGSVSTFRLCVMHSTTFVNFCVDSNRSEFSSENRYST